MITLKIFKKLKNKKKYINNVHHILSWFSRKFVTYGCFFGFQHVILNFLLPHILLKVNFNVTFISKIDKFPLWLLIANFGKFAEMYFEFLD